MARERLGGAKMMLRLPEGVAERIDAVAGPGKRAEWIREAINFSLASSVPLETQEARRREPIPKVDGGRPGPRLIRSAKEALAVVKAPPERSRKSARSAPNDDRWTADNLTFMRAIEAKPLTSRELSVQLGWPPMRVSKAEQRLSAAGRIRYDGGRGWAAT